MNRSKLMHISYSKLLNTAPLVKKDKIPLDTNCLREKHRNFISNPIPNNIKN